MPRAIVAACCLILFLQCPAPALEIEGKSAGIGPMLGRGKLTGFGQIIGAYVAIGEAGAYELTANLRATQDDGLWPLAALQFNGLAEESGFIQGEESQRLRCTVRAEPGVYTVGVCLLNQSDGFFKQLSLQVESIVVEPANGGAQPLRSGPEEWIDSAVAREEALLAKTQAQIEEHRTSTAEVRVTNAAGEPVAGASVSVMQESHDFLFGANIFGWDKYHAPATKALFQERFKALFNYATLPFYWPVTEPVEGVLVRTNLTGMAAWCKANGIEMKGHPLLWNSPHGIPPWAKGTMPGEDKQRERVTKVIEQFKDSIHIWEVVNEPANEPGVPLRAPHQWARETQPEAYLIINEFGQFYNGHPVFHHIIEESIAEGVPFDAIGIQAHAPENMAWPLDKVWAVLDRYAAFGKDIHITEFIAPSNGARVLGSPWRGTWTETQQAAYAEAFYRVCFAHPAVKAISWWDLSEAGAWVKGGALLHDSLDPKPAYTRLGELIHGEWKTRAERTTGQDGTAQWRGFHGTYAITVETPGGSSETAELHVRPGEENAIEIQLTD